MCCGASSDRFLAFAVDRVRASGRIAHLDLTIVCESPGVYRRAPRHYAGEYRQACRESTPSALRVKATTSEKLGFTGRGEGIVAYATATVRFPG